MVVHSGQVEALEADAGHPVLDLLRPQLRRLLLLLDQPLRRSMEKKKSAAVKNFNFQAYLYQRCRAELYRLEVDARKCVQHILLNTYSVSSAN